MVMTYASNSANRVSPKQWGFIMRFDRFTAKLQQAVSDAQSLAVGKDHTTIEPVHLLLALLDRKSVV